MFPKYARFSLLSIVVSFVILLPVASHAQDALGKTRSITGCLQKGVENGGFYIVDEKAMWELSGKIDAKHVGHKVTVSGHVVQKAQMKEAKLDESEKREASGKPFSDFQVTNLKMVSDSCQ